MAKRAGRGAGRAGGRPGAGAPLPPEEVPVPSRFGCFSPESEELLIPLRLSLDAADATEPPPAALAPASAPSAAPPAPAPAQEPPPGAPPPCAVPPYLPPVKSFGSADRVQSMRRKLFEVQQRLGHLSYSCNDLEEKAQTISHAGGRPELAGPHTEVMDTVQRLLDISRSERGLPPASLCREAAAAVAAAGPEDTDTDGQAAQSLQACTEVQLRVEPSRLPSRPSSAVSSSRPRLLPEDRGGLRDCAWPSTLEAAPPQPAPRQPPPQQRLPHFTPVRLARPSPLAAIPSVSELAAGPSPAGSGVGSSAGSPARIVGTQVLFKPYAEHAVPALPLGSLFAMASSQALSDNGLPGVQPLAFWKPPAGGT